MMFSKLCDCSLAIGYASSFHQIHQNRCQQGFNFSLCIKYCNDVLGMDSSVEADHVNFFGLLTNDITFILFSSSGNVTFI